MTITKIKFSTPVAVEGYNQEQITFTKEVARDDNIPNVIIPAKFGTKSEKIVQELM
ncbi:hypothetical protein [Microseira wollei]|uniref:Uncharacterized protein n=1 Tax=Microseira wollei NIES-4236 TaxID=2530354 RepID=A0AAV3X9X8_9CYAN|nr:hypothetical protein [Microseira wollei]GET38188.1 hypothetical protein MiSe_29420 [Microseira wollei NIES-4236]